MTLAGKKSKSKAQPDPDLDAEKTSASKPKPEPESEAQKKSNGKSKSKSKDGKDKDNEKEEGGQGGGRVDEAKVMVQIAIDICKEFFVDQYELPYAALKIDGRMETLGMGKKRFKNFLGGTFYEQIGIVPKPDDITSAINILKYKASFQGR